MVRYIYFNFVRMVIFCYFLLTSNFMISKHVYYQAVIKEPVVDMNNSFPAPPYDSPIAPGIQEDDCHRTYQGLYNQIVTCIEEKKDAVKVTLQNVKYDHSLDPSKNSFWMHKENIIPLHEISDNARRTIPAVDYAQDPTIVLTYPWNNFSVGTRFKHLAKDDTSDSFAIVWSNFLNNKNKYSYVPRTSAIQEIRKNKQEQRALFVKNINDLVDRLSLSDGIVPYVWGGSSFVSLYKDDDGYKENGLWYRNGKNNPYDGFDCSNLVMRIAQMSGLDFPWKTTRVMHIVQKKLTHNDILQDGDLIWIKGHIIIISSIARNEIVEARGYKSGYGKLHKLTLEEAFENMSTYDELQADYFNKKPLRLKDAQGGFYAEMPFEILKLL